MSIIQCLKEHLALLFYPLHHPNKIGVRLFRLLNDISKIYFACENFLAYFCTKYNFVSYLKSKYSKICKRLELTSVALTRMIHKSIFMKTMKAEILF